MAFSKVVTMRILVVAVLIFLVLVFRNPPPHHPFDFPKHLNSTFDIPKLQTPIRPSLVPIIVGPAVSVYPAPGVQTYPRAIKLRSGVLLVALTTFEPENAISISISNDSGTSWVLHSTVINGPAPNIQVNNAFLFEVSTGRILCALRCHTLKPEAVGAEEKPGGENEGYLYFRLMVYYSDDVGETWHYLSTPVEAPGPVHGLWEPFLRLSNKGELQLYYSREEGSRDQDNLMRVSRDGGLSWSSDAFVSGSLSATRDGMMGVQELVPRSGNLITVFESVEEKGAGATFESRFAVWSVFSLDDGKTWSERRVIYEAFWNPPVEHSIKRNAGAPGIALVGKTLVVSFMTDEERLEGMWHRNAYIKILTSDDGGATWGNKLIIADMPAAWAGLLVLNETNFLVLCEHNDRVEAVPIALVPGS